MIPKPKYTTYNIYIRDESEDSHVFRHSIFNGLTIRLPIPDTTEKYRIPHELASHIETELQIYMLTEEEREQAKQEEKTAYNKGFADAWEALKKLICEYSTVKTREILCNEEINRISDIFDNYTAAEATAKIEAYEKKQNEIKVGDEVVMYFMSNDTGVVTRIHPKGQVCIMWKDGSLGRYDILNCKKTGRHFPQVEELLKAMKESPKP